MISKYLSVNIMETSKNEIYVTVVTNPKCKMLDNLVYAIKS